jgi:precorrin-6B methylase 2
MNAKQLARRFGMLSEDEVDAIHYTVGLIKTQNPVAVNIGAGAGTSTIAMLEASPDIVVFEVDKKPYTQSIENLATSKFATQNRVKRIIGNSWGVGRNWPLQADLVFVDGGHHDEAVINDIEAWRPHVKPFGYMLFHDYKHPNVPGLTVVVDRMMADCLEVCSARYLIGYQVGA